MFFKDYTKWTETFSGYLVISVSNVQENNF